jgi:GNAT superfamily N-acetyltransferase
MTDNDFVLILTDRPSPDAAKLIDSGLARYNEQQAGYVDARPLAVLITDRKKQEVLGGLLGRTSFGLLFVDLVYVPDSLRGRNLGSRILDQAEQEAVRRGCSAAVLFTIIFQASRFYAKRGYRELGRVECDPPGYTRICMTKPLIVPQGGGAFS